MVILNLLNKILSIKKYLIFIFLAPIYSVKLESLNPVASELGNIEAIGILLFSRYLIAFEMCAVMLLVAMVAGIILIHKDMNNQSSIEEML